MMTPFERARWWLLIALTVGAGTCVLVGIYGFLAPALSGAVAGVLGTASIAAGAALLALPALGAWERHAWHPLGPIAVLAVGVGAITLTVAMWEQLRFLRAPGFEAAAWITTAAAVAFALMTLIARARLRARDQVLRLVAVLCLLLAASAIAVTGLYGRSLNVDWWYQGTAIVTILALFGVVSIIVLDHLDRTRPRPVSVTTDLVLSLRCPRCGTGQDLPAGRSRCKTCGLTVVIEIEEERCPGCGYVLYKLASPRCPECGTLVLPASESPPMATTPRSAGAE